MNRPTSRVWAQRMVREPSFKLVVCKRRAEEGREKDDDCRCVRGLASNDRRERPNVALLVPETEEEDDPFLCISGLSVEPFSISSAR